jgi:hypothetical protein
MPFQSKERKIKKMFAKAEGLASKGLDCLYKHGDCCKCPHDDPYIMRDNKPVGCSCRKCKRFDCGSCTMTGKNDLCVVMTQIAMED